VELFRDRRDAGKRLAARLEHLRGTDPVVLGLPRGGVPVAAEVARALGAPLDVIVVRKLGVPFQPELGMGAIGEGGVRVLNEQVIRLTGATADEIAGVEERERAEVTRRARLFRGDRPSVPLAGRTVIVVDDGIATGGTARAALQVARGHGAARIVLAVPVASPDAIQLLSADADEIICLETPQTLWAIGRWYEDFTQTRDDEVVGMLAQAAANEPVPATATFDDPPAAVTEDPPTAIVADEEVQIHAGSLALAGRLTVPADAIGIVLFAHGSGSSRHSPRNRYVAQALNNGGLATLLFDLLTTDEEVEREKVFDVALLAERLALATAWLGGRAEVADLPVGYFGASTGAAAALWAAADPTARVGAVVSRGGRPDLAGSRLSEVRAPTLLIVGGHDDVVLELNREAARQLRCEHRIDVVPGATHLFEERGALGAVADLACRWFAQHLGAAAPPAA